MSVYSGSLRWMKQGSWWPRPSAVRRHPAAFDHATIHFNLTTNVSEPINLERASRLLLDSGLAWSAAWPSERGVRLSRGLGEFDRATDSAEQFMIDAGSVTTRQQWRRLRRRHRTLLNGDAAADDAVAAASVEDTVAEAVDSIDGARTVLLDHQKVSAVERAVDRHLFSGRSQDEDHFVRLLLANSYHSLRGPGDTLVDPVVFEPRLLLHQSGLIQLTIALPLAWTPTTEDVVKFTRADNPAITTSKVPAPLIEHLDREHLRGDWTGSEDVGSAMWRTEFDEPATLEDVLNLHLGAVTSIARLGDTQAWMIHPTTILRAARCCSSPRIWAKRHNPEMQQISARFQGPMKPSAGWTADEDFSVSPHTSTYLNIGASTHLIRSGSGPDAADHWMTVMVVEHALNYLWRLRMLETRATAFRLTPRDLDTLYADSISALAEFSQTDTRYGSAREMSRRLISEHGGHNLRDTLIATLNLSAQVFATRSAVRSASRQNSLAVIGLLVAIVVAIPTVQQLLSLKTDDRGSFGPFIVDWAARNGVLGASALTVAVVVTIAALSWTFLRLRRLQRRVSVPRRFRRRGHGASREIEVALGPEDDPW